MCTGKSNVPTMWDCHRPIGGPIQALFFKKNAGQLTGAKAGEETKLHTSAKRTDHLFVHRRTSGARASHTLLTAPFVAT